MEPGYFSEECLESFAELLEFAEEGGELYDFTRCIRPNGTAYGTRGACQTPNKPAPKQDVSQMNQKDFIAGGGVSAVGKGLSTTQIVNRGRDARARAFKAGGGTASMEKQGLSRDQVVQQGSANRARAIKAGGGAKPGASAKQLDAAAKTGAKNRAEAFKAGGGKAALARGERLEDIISKGASNLKAAYGAGGGKAAAAKSKDSKKVIEQGKAALQGAAKAGGGNVRKGQDILADPMGYTNRSTFEAGGGKAMLDKVSQAMSKSLGRKLTEKEMEDVKARVAGRGVKNLDKLFKAGGGSAAVSKGKTVDDVINTGEKTLKDKRRRQAAERAAATRSKLERGSQFT